MTCGSPAHADVSSRGIKTPQVTIRKFRKIPPPRAWKYNELLRVPGSLVALDGYVPGQELSIRGPSSAYQAAQTALQYGQRSPQPLTFSSTGANSKPMLDESGFQ